MTRRNLAVNPNATQGTTGWTVVNRGTLNDGLVGARKCLEFVTGLPDGANPPIPQLPNSGVGSLDFIPVLPNTAYSVSGDVFIPEDQPSADVQIRVLWYTSAFVVTGAGLIGEIVDVVAGEDWVRLTKGGAGHESPADAAYAKIQVLQVTAGGTPLSKFYVDSILFEQSKYVGAYIDNYTRSEEREIVNRALSAFYDRDPFNEVELNADVELGTLVLNTIDEDGYVWICSDIDGWWTLSDPVIPDIPRGVRDGSYDVSGRYAARLLTLSGSFFVPNKSDVDVARRKLVSAINLVRKGAWLKTAEDPTRAAFVRLSGRPMISTVNARGRTEFVIGLKAADPVKYKWDDSNVEGITSATIDLAGEAPDEFGVLTVENEGDATVAVDLVFTGPLGAGSTVFVEHLDPTSDNPEETMTIVEALRGANNVATIVNLELADGVATLTTLEPHGLSVGEIIEVGDTVQGVLHGNDLVVTNVSKTPPYTVSYVVDAADIPSQVSGGNIGLPTPDVMVVDTYHRNVVVNDLDFGFRSKLDTLVDWVTLEPGLNRITFTDSIDTREVTLKEYVYNTTEGQWQARLTTNGSHFLEPGDTITVFVPETAEIAFKEITDEVATITTAAPHGFSVGDVVEVTTVTATDVLTKALNGGTNEATLTFVDDGAIQAGDSIVVALPEDATVVQKTRTNDAVTLKTAVAHGFSDGDSVTVSMPVDNTITKKRLTSNQATITTGTPHNFSIGDIIRVALPLTANVVSKTIGETQVTLATNVAHGFSTGDTVDVLLSASATLANNRSFADSVVTMNTTAAHNFSVGDALAIAPGLGETVSVTSRTSAGTTRTLTAAGHKFSVGEQVEVTNVAATYNGTFTISAVVPGTSFSYVGTSSLTEGATGVSGSATNITIRDGYSTVPHTLSVTNRSATSTTCTLTAAGHKFVVGDSVTISSVSARYNGTYTLTFADQTAGTFSYTFAGTSETSTATSGTVVNQTIKYGPRGSKVIVSVPSSTSFTYYYYGQEAASTSLLTGTAPTLVNITNTDINGQKVLTSASGTSLVYTRT
ncbi:MAG: hypothetical protein ACRC5T_03700 [Cetobacterium sp.]